jgi:hypothetical protein
MGRQWCGLWGEINRSFWLTGYKGIPFEVGE